MTAIFNVLQEFLAQIAGVEENVIVPEAHLFEDLGVEPRLELPKILAAVNDELDTELTPDQFLKEPYELQTIETLAKLLKEDQEL